MQEGGRALSSDELWECLSGLTSSLLGPCTARGCPPWVSGTCSQPSPARLITLNQTAARSRCAAHVGRLPLGCHHQQTSSGVLWLGAALCGSAVPSRNVSSARRSQGDGDAAQLPHAATVLRLLGTLVQRLEAASSTATASVAAVDIQPSAPLRPPAVLAAGGVHALSATAAPFEPSAAAPVFTPSRGFRAAERKTAAQPPAVHAAPPCSSHVAGGVVRPALWRCARAPRYGAALTERAPRRGARLCCVRSQLFGVYGESSSEAEDDFPDDEFECFLQQSGQVRRQRNDSDSACQPAGQPPAYCGAAMRAALTRRGVCVGGGGLPIVHTVGAALCVHDVGRLRRSVIGQ